MSKWQSTSNSLRWKKNSKKPKVEQNASMKRETILNDFKELLHHAKEKGDSELGSKLELKLNELERLVIEAKSEVVAENNAAHVETDADTSLPKSCNGENSILGVELDENSVKFKDEGSPNEITVFSRWQKYGPAEICDLIPDTGPVCKYNDLILKSVNQESLQLAVRKLSSINTLKHKGKAGFELTEWQAEKVLSEESVTDEILEIISKKFSGLYYIWMCQKVPKNIKKGTTGESNLFYPYTRNNEAFIKKSRRSKITKHLREIQSLKKNLKDGLELTSGQMVKIKREEELLEELADQHLGLHFI